LPEADFGQLCGDVFSFQCRVEVSLCFCRRDVPDGLEQVAVIEPVDPFQGGIVNGFKTAPGASSMEDFRLEQAVDGLGQGVVVAVPEAFTEASMRASDSR
jgi:hypothetical protein